MAAQQQHPSEVLVGQSLSARFTIGDYVAGGSYGSFHYGVEEKTGERVAIKLEKRDAPQPQIHLEYGFYRRLGNARFIPKVHYIGMCPGGEWHALVLDLLGPSLLNMTDKCGGTFSLLTSTQLMIQLVDIFEYVHDHGIIYRDVKPENFLIGLPSTDKWATVNLIDLGFCKMYIQEDNTHIEFKTGKGVAGTARYMSVNNHSGREVSRRDDLESILYMMVYLHKGQVPWQGVQTTCPKERNKQIGHIKENTTPQALCADMPPAFATFLSEVKALKFEKRPSYRKLNARFVQTLMQMGASMHDQNYDWDKEHNRIQTSTKP